MTPAEELAQYLGAPASEVDASKLVPMLCEREEAAARILSRAGWLFELKLDGVRIVADKRGDHVKLFYRKLREATDTYAEIAAAIASISESRVVLDGEIVAFDEQGRPDFQRLGHRIQTGTRKGHRSPIFVPVVYVVFDVIAIGPHDLRGFPLEARKEILSRIIPPEGISNGTIRQHPTFDNGVELFRLCREHRLEGVVAKKLGSSYRGGERSLDWLKIKCEIDAEFVVVGWTEGESDRARLGALDLGAYEGDRLVFRGRVGSGLHGAIIDQLLELLVPIEVPHPVAEGKYSPKPRRHHCRPELVVSVRYGGFSVDPSGARFLRFPVFRGIRPDVSPKDCTAAPDDAVDLALEHAGSSTASSGGRSRIHITAPSQALLQDGTTKDVLCRYFESVAPALLRHAHGRACTFRRPDGAALWPPPKWTPKFARTATLRAGEREVRGFVVDSVDTLLFAVEAGSPYIQYGPFLEDRSDVVDFVAVRVTAAWRDGLARAARGVRAIAMEVGLPAAAKSAGPRSIDVLVGLGAAPVLAAAPLGRLLAHLAADAELRASVESGDVSIEAVESVPAPFSPCVDAASSTVVFAVPIGWDELDTLDVSTIGLEVAAARAAAATTSDPLDAITGVTVDVAAATSAIERVIASALGSSGMPR